MAHLDTDLPEPAFVVPITTPEWDQLSEALAQPVRVIPELHALIGRTRAGVSRPRSVEETS